MESLSKKCGWDDGLGTAQGVEGAWQAGLVPGLVCSVMFGASKVCPGEVSSCHLGCAPGLLLHHTGLSIRYHGGNVCLEKSKESGVRWALQNVAGRAVGLLGSSE